MSLNSLIKKIIKEVTEEWVDISPEEYKELLDYVNGDGSIIKRLPDCNKLASTRGYGTFFLHLLPNGFTTPTTTTLAFIKAGYNVAFEPIDARQRTGESKIRFARDGVKFFVIILKIVTLFSPLRVFLPVSLTAFTLGASYAAWTIATQSHVTNSSVLLIMLAVIVFLVGLLSEQIAAMRFEGRQ